MTVTIVLVLLLAVTASPAAALFLFPGATGVSNMIPTAARLVSCTSDIAFRPDNTTHLANFMVTVRQQFQGRSLRIRATRAESHTSSTFVCPTKGTNSSVVNVWVDTAYLNRTLEVDTANMRVTIQAGMQLVKLQRELHTRGWGLPSHSYPLFSALSVGGLFSVSAHGSNVDGNDTMLKSVVAVKLVDGLGRVQTNIDPALLAGSIGLFGIITEMTIQAVPATKTRLIVKRYENDANITAVVQEEIDISAVTPGRSLVLWWRASPSDFTIYQMQVVPASTPGEAYNTQFAPIDPLLAPTIPVALATENSLPNTADLGSCIFSSTLWQPKNRDGTTVPNWTPAVGWSWEIEASGCQYGDDGVSAIVAGGINRPNGCGDSFWTIAQYYDFEWVVPLSRWPLVVSTVKSIYRKALPLYNLGSCTRAFLIRFGRTTDKTLVSTHYGAVDDRVLYISLPGLKAKWQTGMPPKYSQFWDEWEQWMLGTLGARPHWGKNNDRSFSHPSFPVRNLYPRFNELLALKQPYDPDGVFENDLFRRVKARQGYDLTAKCQSDFKCYCTSNLHCSLGQVCGAGVVFPQYKVCRPPTLGDLLFG